MNIAHKYTPRIVNSQCTTPLGQETACKSESGQLGISQNNQTIKRCTCMLVCIVFTKQAIIANLLDKRVHVTTTVLRQRKREREREREGGGGS